MGRIHTTADGRKLHVGGRLPPKKPHGLMLHAPKYGLDLSQWPATLPQTTYGQAAAAQPVLADIFGNDKYGCCTEADAAHGQALRQAAGVGTVYHPSLDVVLGWYGRDGGFDINNPTTTDNGCDETVVLGNEQSQGIQCADDGALDKIALYVAVDGSNRDLVRACVQLFVGGSICAALPQSWIDSAVPGATWGVPTDSFNPNDGHCFTLGDQADANLSIWTWAMPLVLTYDGLAAATSSSNGGALYFRLSQEILNAASKACPDGLDWDTLIADANALPSGVMTPPGP